MGEIMQWTASITTDIRVQPLARAQSNVLVYPSRTRRGLPLASVTDGAAAVERVLCAAHLDAAMRVQLTRVLLVTVRDWCRR